MDLLKTLLFYMIMTSAGATLESGATPIPYEQLSTPTPVVTATPTPTATPAPTATPTPALYTLNVGSRGTYVRTLQQKLADMGYLKGAPDGIYGNQTRDAVAAFQRRNGLEDDGVAGPKTLSKLYYDPDALPARGMPTATPTAAPTKVPASARITIQYQTADGETLAIDSELCYAGETLLLPRPELLPAGYRIVQDSQTVQVSKKGVAESPVITFLCEPVLGVVNVRYQLQDGTLLASQTLSYLAGTHTLTADDSLVPAGCKLLNQRLVAFAVSLEGVVSPETIVFIYAPAPEAIAVIPAAPTQAPTAVPTQVPTSVPTQVPTAVPTQVPTAVPTQVPTSVPTQVPTSVPTQVPTSVPTQMPTAVPTQVPTAVPTQVSTAVPTQVPTAVPTQIPTSVPTQVPTAVPTQVPTSVPTQVPTAVPTQVPAAEPTAVPTATPAPTPGVIIEISSDLPVHYCLGDMIIAETHIPLPRQDMLVYPDPTLLPAGYELVSLNAQNLLADALPHVVVFEVQEIFRMCSVDIVYETTDGQLLAIERRNVSTLDGAVTPDFSLVPAQLALASASPITIPFEQIISQSPDPVIFRFDPIVLTPSAVCVTVDGKLLDVPFQVDEQHRLYLPLKQLSFALMLSCNTDNGFACDWQGHALSVRCEDGAVTQVTVDEQPVELGSTLLITCRDDEIYASVALFELLGYTLSADHSQLISAQ